MTPKRRLPPHRRVGARPQQGIVIIFILIALVIMLIGAVAMAKSFNASMFMAGNLAFKRDLVNQAERAVAAALADLETGALTTQAARASNLQTSNYRAQMFTGTSATTGVNAQGIPNALLSDSAFASVGSSARDITVDGQGVRVRYLIDRLCNNSGDEVTLTSANCTVGPTPNARGGSGSQMNVATQPPQVLYRLSVRVDGPRNTQAFFQTTLAI